MGAFLITGYPGTGKSSVAKELQKRGRAAYDTEAMRGYMHAVSITTGRRIPIPNPVPSGWFNDTGACIWDAVKLPQLLAQPKTVFVCALADNQEAFYHLFDAIFLLVLDQTIMRHRLVLRTTCAYGKDDGELSDIFTYHRQFEQSLLAQGALPIDTDKPLPEVVNDILAHVQSLEPSNA